MDDLVGVGRIEIEPVVVGKGVEGRALWQNMRGEQVLDPRRANAARHAVQGRSRLAGIRPRRR